MLKKFTTLFSLFLVTTYLNSSYAEDINVINKTKKEIVVEISPENSEGEVFSTITKIIPAHEDSKLMVNYDDLKGQKYYNIKKVDGDFAGHSRCDHLSVNKNYTIEFKKEAIGVICTANVVD